MIFLKIMNSKKIQKFPIELKMKQIKNYVYEKRSYNQVSLLNQKRNRLKNYFCR